MDVSTVIIAGTYVDNYLTLGSRSFLVLPEDIRAAEVAAQKAIAEVALEAQADAEPAEGALAKPKRRPKAK